jgi:hypothetical protein
MVRCPECYGINTDDNLNCRYCGCELPPEPIREYLLRNSPIFTIAALFTALTFYLLTLVKESQATQINGTILINSILPINGTQEIIKPGNFSYTILIQPGILFQKSFILPIPPNEELILAFLSCFLILFGVICALLVDLKKSTKGNPQIYHVFLFLLLASFVSLIIIYILSFFFTESLYFLFFTCWVAYIFLILVCWKWIFNYIRKKKYFKAFLFTLFTITLPSSILYLIFAYNKLILSLNNPNLEYSLAIGIIGSTIISIIILFYTSFSALVLLIVLILAKGFRKILIHARLHPNGKVAEIISIPHDFIEICKDILYCNK